jgi:hypothetical protein
VLACETAAGARATQEPPQEEWRRPYPLFPRLLFVLDGTGLAGVDNRISALGSAAAQLGPTALPGVSVLAAALTVILRDGRSAPVWRPVHDPHQRVPWNH